MTTCLLCSAHAAADGLCVEDGARLWAAMLWKHRHDCARAWHAAPSAALTPTIARAEALHDMPTPKHASVFLDRYEAAKKANAEAPQCS
jgi:hypothetical protein